VYDWKWYYGVQGWLVSLALVLAMAIPQANRDRRALLILVPLAVASLAWFLLKAAVRIPSPQLYPFDMMVHCLVMGLAVLWLLASGLCWFRGGTRFLVSLGIVCVVTGLEVLSSASTSLPETMFLLTSPVILVALLLNALAATARQCREDHSPVRFMLRLGLWTTIGGVIVAVGYFVILTSILSLWLRPPNVAGAGLVGLVLGVFLYLLNLPYMVLGFVSPFFRDRLQRCLGLTLIPKGGARAISPGSSSGP
jgi:hypothetical protein